MERITQDTPKAGGTSGTYHFRSCMTSLIFVWCLLQATLGYSQSTWMGMRLTTGGTPVSINALGRICAPGNSGTHQLKLVLASDGKDVPGSAVSVSMAGATVGEFKYASLSRTITLLPNTAYYLVSNETEGGDSWYDVSTSLSTTDVAVCQGGVYWNGSGWVAEGNRNNSYVPVSFTYGLRDPENPSGTTAGLDYSYYEWYNEGDWRLIPNFAAMTPQRTGTVPYFNISGNSREDFFAFRFTGYINVPTDGIYTFYTFADDVCNVYIGDAIVVQNEEFVNEKSGSIGLKAGRHAITVLFMERTGANILHYVQYQGPGIPKQAIPASALSRGGSAGSPTPPPVDPNPPVVVNPGTYAGYYRFIAKHSGKTIDVSGVSTANGARVHQWGSHGGANQQWSITDAGEGYYKITSKHSNKALTVTSSISEAEQWEYTGNDTQKWKIEPLEAGYYKLTNKATGKVLDVAGVSTADGARILQWEYNGGDNQKWRLDQVAGSARIAAAQNAELEDDQTVNLYPNPAQDQVQLTHYATAAGEANVTISDAASQVKMNKAYALKAGTNTLLMNVKTLKSGVYFLQFATPGKQVTKKLVITK